MDGQMDGQTPDKTKVIPKCPPCYAGDTTNCAQTLGNYRCANKSVST